VLELGDEFATLDAGRAGSEQLKKIPGALALKGKTAGAIDVFRRLARLLSAPAWRAPRER